MQMITGNEIDACASRLLGCFMEMKPEVAEAPKYRGGTHRVFWWGVVFWVLAWIGAVCGIVMFDVTVKGCREVKMGTGAGSLICHIGTHRASSTGLKIGEHQWIWTGDTLQQITQNRGISGVLAYGGLQTSSGTISVALPVAGFLWLWLAVAWVVSAKRKRSLVALSLALVVLGCVMAYGVVEGRRIRDTGTCLYNIRNIQQAVRSACSVEQVAIGAPIPWGHFFGPGGYMSPESRCCPAGQEYQLEPLQPGIGQAAAHCQNPDHQRALRLKWDTSNW